MIGIGAGVGVPFVNKGGGGPSVNNDFVIEVDTTQAGSASDTITLPLLSGGTYSGTIDWGDSNSDDLTYANRQHTYASGGTYTITISGDTFEGFRYANGGDKAKLIDIQNWGFITLNANSVFRGCSNMDISATDVPTITTTSLYEMFRSCSSLTTPDLSGWDTSSVTSFVRCFAEDTNFNGNLDGWDVSSATTLQEMFQLCPAFNYDVSGWDVSSCQSFVRIFRGCSVFNQDVGGWNMSAATNCQAMFQSAVLFNQNLSSWDVSSVVTFREFAFAASAFNNGGDSGIDNWDISSATSLARMFRQSPFNQPIGSWDTSSVTDMGNTFYLNSAFDQDISGWDVNQVTQFISFLQGGQLSTANYDALLIAWDAQGAMSYSGTVNFGTSKYSCKADAARTSLITKWGGITDGGLNTSINCDFVSTWDTTQAGSASDTVELPLLSGGTYSGTIDWGDGGATSALSYANRTHTYASSGTYTITISGTIEGWQFNNGGDRRKITDISNWGNLTITTNSAFYGCQNMDVSATDSPTISSTTLQYCFRNCQSITSMDLSGCDVSGVTNMTSMFNNCQAATSFGISGWDTSNVNAMNYPSAQIGMFQNCLLWNEDISGWDVSNVTTFQTMFSEARAFNADLSGWDVSNATNMLGMFVSARAFNSDISSWNVSNVTKMTSMFRGAWAFNQNIGSWNTSNVTTMSRMFDSARDFNNGGSDSIRNWDVSSNTTMYVMFGRGSFSGSQDTLFNQPIGDWDTSSVTDMSSVFHQNTAFDQDISNWDITNVTSMQFLSFEFGSTTPISTANYDALLIAWEADLQTAYPSGSGYTATITVDFETSQFSNALMNVGEARYNLVNVFGWTISDGGGV